MIPDCRVPMETRSGHRQPRRQQEGTSTEPAGDEGTTGTRQQLRPNAAARREHTSTGHSSYKAREFRSPGQEQAAARIRERGKPTPGCGWDAENLLGKQRELPCPWAVPNGLGYLSCPITAAQCSTQAHESSAHSAPPPPGTPSRQQGKADNAWPRITSPTLN